MHWRVHLAGACAAIALSARPLDGAQVVDRVSALEPFVGVWDTADTFETVSGPVTERGERRCARSLRGTYVECTTVAPRQDGAEREYRFLMSWDEAREAYTLIQVWSDVPGHSVTTLTPSEDGQTWELRSVTPQLRGQVERRSWGTIQFDGPNRMTWTGRANTSTDPPDLWRHVFREVSTRRRSDLPSGSASADAGDIHRNLLTGLVGTWTFRLGDRRGVRTIRPLYGDFAVEYVETFEGTGIEGRGVMTFDAARRRYVSMGLHNRAGSGGASLGTPLGDGAVVFRPTVADDEPHLTESWLVVRGPDRFDYELRQQIDGTWRTAWTAEFTRRP